MKKKNNSLNRTVSVKISISDEKDLQECGRLLMIDDSEALRLAVRSFKNMVLGVKHACVINGKFERKMFYRIICFPEKLGIAQIGASTWRPFVLSFKGIEKNIMQDILEKIKSGRLNK